MIAASEALDRLRDGNTRFVLGENIARGPMNRAQRSRFATGQAPFAVVLGCSDSRVPVELIFDQGVGDLFVVRVAGNVVAAPVIGSVEFAALQLGSRLVVVLGHSKCGAVKVTLDELLRPSEGLSRGLDAIVDSIRPAVEGVSGERLADDQDVLLQHAVRENVRYSVQRLQNDSEVLTHLIRDDGLVVVGAEYSLETGRVDFFDVISKFA
jgi:carbonic anhydrase